MINDLVMAIADLKEEEAIGLVKARVDAGQDPLTILEEARRGMEIVGQRFADKEYFVPDLVYSGEILSQISSVAKSRVKDNSQVKRLGTCVIGTVAGDIHDIGKNIVTFMLEANGFLVHDLGVDVPAAKFVEKTQEIKPEIVALSGFLTCTFKTMKETIETLTYAGLRSQVKIMVGGGQVDEYVKEYTKADGFGTDAITAVRLAKEWAGSR